MAFARFSVCDPCCGCDCRNLLPRPCDWWHTTYRVGYDNNTKLSNLLYPFDSYFATKSGCYFKLEFGGIIGLAASCTGCPCLPSSCNYYYGGNPTSFNSKVTYCDTCSNSGNPPYVSGMPSSTCLSNWLCLCTSGLLNSGINSINSNGSIYSSGTCNASGVWKLNEKPEYCLDIFSSGLTGSNVECQDTICVYRYLNPSGCPPTGIIPATNLCPTTSQFFIDEWCWQNAVLPFQIVGAKLFTFDSNLPFVTGSGFCSGVIPHLSGLILFYKEGSYDNQVVMERTPAIVGGTTTTEVTFNNFSLHPSRFNKRGYVQKIRNTNGIQTYEVEWDASQSRYVQTSNHNISPATGICCLEKWSFSALTDSAFHMWRQTVATPNYEFNVTNLVHNSQCGNIFTGPPPDQPDYPCAAMNKTYTTTNTSSRKPFFSEGMTDGWLAVQQAIKPEYGTLINYAGGETLVCENFSIIFGGPCYNAYSTFCVNQGIVNQLQLWEHDSDTQQVALEGICPATITACPPEVGIPPQLDPHRCRYSTLGSGSYAGGVIFITSYVISNKDPDPIGGNACPDGSTNRGRSWARNIGLGILCPTLRRPYEDIPSDTLYGEGTSRGIGTQQCIIPGEIRTCSDTTTPSISLSDIWIRDLACWPTFSNPANGGTIRNV